MNAIAQAELREPAWMHPTAAEIRRNRDEQRVADLQAKSARQARRALSDAAQIISSLEFPHGSPFVGFDVKDVVSMLLGDFMPVED